MRTYTVKTWDRKGLPLFSIRLDYPQGVMEQLGEILGTEHEAPKLRHSGTAAIRISIGQGKP